MAKKALKAVAKQEPLKLDLGCGKNKQPGFIGVDAINFDGVDVVCDLRAHEIVPINGRPTTIYRKWPWDADSVEHVHCSHFLEHLTPSERIHFANELFRVMRKGAQALIVTPYAGHDCAFGDPTHQWPPISGWTYLYWNAAWRKANAPHVDAEHAPGALSCDFDYTIAGSWEQWLATRNMETRVFAMQHYLNSQRDVIATLTKR